MRYLITVVAVCVGIFILEFAHSGSFKEAIGTAGFFGLLGLIVPFVGTRG